MILIKCCCSGFLDIFSVGRWREIFTSSPKENPRILALKNDIPEYCLKSKAENTYKKYKYAFNINVFCKWCSSFEPRLVSLPATESTIAAYLIYLSKNLNSTAKIQEAVYPINWAHSLGGFQNPCESTLVRSVKEGANS